MVKSERKEAWFRIIVAIVTGIILYFWGIAVAIVAVLNWIIVLFSGNRNKDMAEFCELWNTTNYEYLRYLISLTNQRPFPFTSLAKPVSKFK